MPPYPQRKSPRLQGYDYTREGAYFITIVTHGRAHLFGTIIAGKMVLSDFGKIAHGEITKIPAYWGDAVDIDVFVVMPNHIHVIVVLTGMGDKKRDGVGTPFSASAPPTPTPFAFAQQKPNNRHTNNLATGGKTTDAQKRVPTVGRIISGYKGGVTRRARTQNIIEDGLSPWQTRYYDHIIRNEPDLNRIRAYIITNPARWDADSVYGDVK